MSEQATCHSTAVQGVLMQIVHWLGSQSAPKKNFTRSYDLLISQFSIPVSFVQSVSVVII